MRHYKPFILVLVLLILSFVMGAASAESTLVRLWDSTTAFLFHTDNVTVIGEAVFTLDGTRFKTAQLNYVQDGFSSYYGLKLLTPRKDGAERESGWTIIADEEGNIAIMEAYDPGTYRTGTGTAHNTLLRRSIQLDALTELGGILIGQMEGMMPEDAVTVTENENVRNVHIRIKGDQIPEMVVSALNVAAGYLSDRWFSYSHDRELGNDNIAFENYVTVTEALTDGTVKWTLQDADIEIVLDAQGRLSAVSGTVNAASAFWDGDIREVEVRLDVTMKDYGTSHVKPFDPEDYHVVPQREMFGENIEMVMDDAAWENIKQQAEGFLQKQGYRVSANADWGGQLEENGITLSMDEPEDSFFFIFAQDGSLLSLQRVTAEWLTAGDEAEADGVYPDIIAAAEAYIRSFLADAHPILADQMGSLEPQSDIHMEDGTRYLSFYAEQGSTFFVVQVEPSMRIEYYYADITGD